jgi:DNA-damage-inducible protein D
MERIMLAIMADADIFHFEDDRESFEDRGHANGGTTWYASDLMECLEYSSPQAFNKVVNRAIGVCTSLSISVEDNFRQVKKVVDGVEISDHKLSRFACYLVAMNGDPKKAQVAKAQAYFAQLAQVFQKYIEQAQDVERVAIREDVTEHEHALSGIAKTAGVSNYAFFQNAGYRGLYNMNLRRLRQVKGVPESRSPLDFMGKRELAANLFRIAETRGKDQERWGQRTECPRAYSGVRGSERSGLDGKEHWDSTGELALGS